MSIVLCNSIVVFSAANINYKLLSNRCHVTQLPQTPSCRLTDWWWRLTGNMPFCGYERNLSFFLWSLYIRYAAVSKYLSRASFNSAGFSCPGYEVKETSLPQSIMMWEVGDWFWQLRGERDVTPPPQPWKKILFITTAAERFDTSRLNLQCSNVEKSDDLWPL